MKCLWIVFFIWAGLSSAAAKDPAVELKIFGRPTVQAIDFTPEKADQRWLADKGVLRIGVSSPDYPPFDITTYTHDYEGITADYSALLGKALKVPLKVLRYPDRTALIHALLNQEIDLIGTANNFESIVPGIALSEPYAVDQPTIVAPVGRYSSASINVAAKKVAMVDYYLPLETVKQFYPDTEFLLYPSTLNAIGAVALGEADLYLGDSISTGYLISKNYLYTLQVVDFPPMAVNSFSFATLQSNRRLMRLVNNALAVIPATERRAIAHRWTSSTVGITSTRKIKFTPKEQQWIEQHPRVRVLYNRNFLPFTYTDEQGKFRGLSADVLCKISLLTGLKFQAIEGTSVNKTIADLRSGKGDLMPALVPGAEREKDVRFTRAYLTPPLVMVVRNTEDAPRSLMEMAGKKLVIIEGNPHYKELHQNFPEIQIVEVGNFNKAFELLARGSVDAVVNSLASARYIIAQGYPGKLKMVSTVGTEGEQIAFAVDKNAPELLSILNKALLSFSPDELDEVTNRWRQAVVLEDSYWARHKAEIIEGLIAVLVVLLGVFAWITSLRREVAKRKKAESALNDKLEFERVLINGTPHPIYARDRNANLLLCNKAYLDTFNVKDGTYLLGTNVIQSLLSDSTQAAQYHQDYLDVMDKGEPSFKDRLLVSASGQVMTIYHWMLPYRGSDGEVKGLIGGWIDVSERQQLVQQLHAAKTEADNANRAKTTFLSTMSHEIRTPMNAVIGMLEIASKAAEQGMFDQEAIEVASDAAKGLLDLIGDILDIARIESGQLSLTPERCNLRDLVMSVVRIFDGPAKQKSLQLQVNVAPEVINDVLIDPMRFKQVLANLISNAIKFTAHGSIQVSVSTCYNGQGDVMPLVVAVKDSGIGISASDQQRLFEPFSQIHSPNEAANKGSGLGLMISRTLVEMMGGLLTLVSKEASGTLIIITLDLPVFTHNDRQAPTPQASVPTSMQPQGTPLSILIVDDYAANRIVLSRQLTYLGHDVSEASDGQQGLAMWNEQPFDVIITDCNMPNMDGYQLTQAIRTQEHVTKEPACLIVGFTANAVPEERQRCLEAGMNDCLFKPISLQQLDALVQELHQVNLDACAGDELSEQSLDQRLKYLAGNDPQTEQALRRELRDSSQQALIELQQRVALSDRQGLSQLAHQIKGGARMLQFEALIITCENLEACYQQPGTHEQLALAVSAMQERIQELLQWLQAE